MPSRKAKRVRQVALLDLALWREHLGLTRQVEGLPLGADRIAVIVDVGEGVFLIK